MAFATTLSTLSRSKKPLTQLPEFQELRRQVTTLQKDSEEQLALEQEAQDTFEYLTHQVRALRDAFKTLSDVVVEEVDALRADGKSARAQLKAMRGEVGAVGAKHAQAAEWTQAVQRELSELQRAVEREVGEECAAVRRAGARHEALIEGHAVKIAALEGGADKLSRELGALTEQRADDLALLQKALEAGQRAQRTASEQVAALERRNAALEGAVAELAGALRAQGQEAVAAMREQHELYENLSSTVDVLKTALVLKSAGGGTPGGVRAPSPAAARSPP
mmetsp:Transcript_26887/g.91778  ORF Transcript_26887/g.91778 Transcript_26887/m.91778 type:complete len:279 (+) Transcript_26887:89-925(+)